MVGQRFNTFASTISDPHPVLGSAPAGLPTSASVLGAPNEAVWMCLIDCIEYALAVSQNVRVDARVASLRCPILRSGTFQSGSTATSPSMLLHRAAPTTLTSCLSPRFTSGTFEPTSIPMCSANVLFWRFKSTSVKLHILSSSHSYFFQRRPTGIGLWAEAACASESRTCRSVVWEKS
jgi:hypothetical protein